MFARGATLFLSESCFGAVNNGSVSVVAGFGEGKEDKQEKGADQSSCYIVDSAPGVVDSDESGSCQLSVKKTDSPRVGVAL